MEVLHKASKREKTSGTGEVESGNTVGGVLVHSHVLHFGGNSARKRKQPYLHGWH